MSKDELIAFLKEHLSVNVRVSRQYGMYEQNGVRVEVELLLDGEEISSSTDFIMLD